MFIYNCKINGGLVLKIIIIVLSLFMLCVFGISVYRIFFTSGKFVIEDKITAKDITEIDSKNYTNVLQAVHENLDSYIGMKVKIKGYIYRLFDFEENEFVIARDMIINEKRTQSVVVGFFAHYKNIKDFKDGTWVDIVGTIEKGKYHNKEIPVIKVIDLKEIQVPEDSYVFPPDSTYIQTNGLL